jgi:hypothetical protein
MALPNAPLPPSELAQAVISRGRRPRQYAPPQPLAPPSRPYTPLRWPPVAVTKAVLAGGLAPAAHLQTSGAHRCAQATPSVPPTAHGVCMPLSPHARSAGKPAPVRRPAPPQRPAVASDADVSCSYGLAPYLDLADAFEVGALALELKHSEAHAAMFSRLRFQGRASE